MIIRKYRETDCKELADLFFNTVHCVNGKDYTEEQLNAWATGKINTDEQNKSFLEHYTLIAEENGIIIGFGDIDCTGYLDRLYVHKDYQRKGVASALCDHLEKYVSGRIFTHASVTAKPFFEKRGYKIIKEQEVKRQGVTLKNYVMEKYTDS